MQEFVPFFFILIFGLFFSTIFNRLHLPWVVALIVAGIAAGASNLFEVTPTIEFFSEIGLVFLMFMAGLETRLSCLRETKREVGILSIVNGLIPFIVALLIGFYFGYGLQASILLGIVFISSSIAVVIPSLEESGLFGTRLGTSAIGTAIVEDIVSLFLLSLFFQWVNPSANISLFIFYPLLVLLLVAIKFIIPRLDALFHRYSAADSYETEPRVVLAMMVGVVIVFELLGLHPIVAGFFLGLVLSDSLRKDETKKKLHVLSYGLFIPFFFVTVGAQTDLSVLASLGGAWVVILVVVLGSVLAKFGSGWLGARLSGFSSLEGSFIGVSTMPQLSTTLAVVFVGQDLGILKPELVTAIVVLSIVTTLISPILIRHIDRKGDFRNAERDQVLSCYN
ncbi:hypothetical protein CL654_03490 [bacterium]|nr:hypothetical protein [bacterium]|tara:strand:+ start:8054 stop:9235 length:1182 start_codon:yes stop_codon:yes gene_type:complete